MDLWLWPGGLHWGHLHNRWEQESYTIVRPPNDVEVALGTNSSQTYHMWQNGTMDEGLSVLIIRGQLQKTIQINLVLFPTLDLGCHSDTTNIDEVNNNIKVHLFLYYLSYIK